MQIFLDDNQYNVFVETLNRIMEASHENIPSIGQGWLTLNKVKERILSDNQIIFLAHVSFAIHQAESIKSASFSHATLEDSLKGDIFYNMTEFSMHVIKLPEYGILKDTNSNFTLSILNDLLKSNVNQSQTNGLDNRYQILQFGPGASSIVRNNKRLEAEKVLDYKDFQKYNKAWLENEYDILASENKQLEHELIAAKAEQKSLFEIRNSAYHSALTLGYQLFLFSLSAKDKNKMPSNEDNNRMPYKKIYN